MSARARSPSLATLMVAVAVVGAMIELVGTTKHEQRLAEREASAELNSAQLIDWVFSGGTRAGYVFTNPR